MGYNRIADFFRDPTLERPATDFYRVRLPWESFIVTPESAARIIAAVSSFGPPTIVRCETITGSVVYVRTDTIMFVQESTRAQRDAERRFWKEIDGEEEKDYDQDE